MADTRKKIEKVHEQLIGKTLSERANIKADELVKVGAQEKQKRGKEDFEILSIEKVKDGIAVFVKAWHEDGEQVGFGADGSVDIERIIIVNPPVLVTDPNGDIVRESTDHNGVVRTQRFREDAQEALMQNVAHTLSVMKNKHRSDNIKRGKVGQTTLTVYPAAGAASPCDGAVRADLAAGGVAWATIQGTDVGNSVLDTSMIAGLRGGTTSNQWRQIIRGIMGFDTSPISTGTVSSATLSVYAIGADNPTGYGTMDVVIDHRDPPASTSAIANTDYKAADWDAVRQSDTEVACTSFSSAGYKDFPFNATGLSNINKTGYSWFGIRFDRDLDNSEPSWSNNLETNAICSGADEAGTTQDPKLVVEYSSSTPVTVTPSAQVATFSIPAPTYKHGSTVAPSAQVATFSLPARVVSLPKVITPLAQVATFSIPLYTLLAGTVTVAANAVTATFSIPAYTVKYGLTLVASVVTATFSLPSRTIAIGTAVLVSVAAQVATFSLPSRTIILTRNIIVAATTQVLTFTLPTLAKVGAIWRKVARSTSGDWTRVSRNSN